MSTALLVLGGSALAGPALRWAREAGLRVILVDPDVRAPARRAAHEFQPLPHDDVAAHVALVRRLGSGDQGPLDGLRGVLATEPRTVALLAPLAEALPGVLPPRRALERLHSEEETRAALGACGVPVSGPDPSGGRELDLLGYFRDGVFVPGGLAARRALASGDVVSVQPSGLAPERARAAHQLAARAARALGVERGLVQVTLCATEEELRVVRLLPALLDLTGALHVAPLAYGKSPLQAWLAHLAGAGGPFDEPVLEPRAHAGWLALACTRAGVFAGVDGVARARAVPGLVDLWLEEPGREIAPLGRETRPLGYLWAEGHAAEELEERLRRARAALEVRVACRQRVA
jgi:hypothetical protein